MDKESLYSNGIYVHYSWQNYLLKNKEGITTSAVEILDQKKKQIIQQYKQRFIKQANRRTKAAFGNEVDINTLKQELFIGADSLQSKLTKYMEEASPYLLKAKPNDENGSINYLASLSKKEREKELQRIYNENNQSFKTLIQETERVVDYYMKLEKYTISILKHLIKTKQITNINVNQYLSNPINVDNADDVEVKECLRELKALRKAISEVKKLGSAAANNSSGKIGDDIFQAFIKGCYGKEGCGWRVGEVASAYALHLALSEGDHYIAKDVTETFAVPTGGLHKTSAGSGLLEIIGVHTKLDPRLKQAKNPSTRSIKADASGKYNISINGKQVQGLIELTYKNYGRYKNKNGIVNRPIELNSELPFRELINLNSRILGNLANPVFYYNLNAAHDENGTNMVKTFWENYVRTVKVLSFMDLMFGRNKNLLMGNNNLFFVDGDKVYSIYDMIEIVFDKPEVITNSTNVRSNRNKNAWRGKRKNASTPYALSRSNNIKKAIEASLETKIKIAFNPWSLQQM